MNGYYFKEVLGLKNTVKALRKMGKTPEQIARTVHKMRRDIGIKYKDLTPEPLRAQYLARNTRDYGDPLGPSIEYFLGKGRSWDDIIATALKPGGDDLGIGVGIDKILGK